MVEYTKANVKLSNYQILGMICHMNYYSQQDKKQK